MKKIDKLSEAKSLRSEGFSYPEIAFKLGCSKAWCAKHLKDVEKGSSDTTKLCNKEYREETLRILETAIAEIKALN